MASWCKTLSSTNCLIRQFRGQPLRHLSGYSTEYNSPGHRCSILFHERLTGLSSRLLLCGIERGDPACSQKRLVELLACLDRCDRVPDLERFCVMSSRISGAPFQGLARACRYLRTVSSTLVTPRLTPLPQIKPRTQLEVAASRMTTICRVPVENAISSNSRKTP